MRLIDADALEMAIMMMYDEELCEDCCYNVVNAIDAAPTVGGWISVNDRLPKDFGEVITAVKYSGKRGLYVQTGEWTGESWVSVWDEYMVSDVKKEVLYWMPLPNTE